MATANWPASLPQRPSPANYKEESVDTSVETKMEVGPSKRRRRISYDVKPHTFKLTLLTSAQVDTLDTFFTVTLLSGTLEFNLLHPRKQTAAVWRMTKPIFTANGPVRYDAEFNMEQMP